MVKDLNNPLLKILLEYLEKKNEIVIGSKGITYIHNPNPRLRKAIAKGLEL